MSKTSRMHTVKKRKIENETLWWWWNKSPNTRLHRNHDFSAITSKPPIIATVTFFTSANIKKIYSKTCSMTPTRKWSFASRPHEASLAEYKGAHDRINSNLDIQWRHAPIREKRGTPHRLAASGSFRAPSFHAGPESGVTNSKKIKKNAKPSRDIILCELQAGKKFNLEKKCLSERGLCIV
jgi:hypothetical protein